MRPTLIKNILNEIRQWCYPQEFRINRPPRGLLENDDNAVLRSLSKVINTLSVDASIAGIQPSRSAADDEQFISELATRLWRLRKCLQQAGSQEPTDGVERGYRHLERLFTRLEHLGIRVVDRTGEFYDPGMSLKVVSSEPMNGIGREIIKETIAPAIYRGENLIQVPQVVVGVPSMANSESLPDDDTISEPETGMDHNQNNNPVKEPDETTFKSE